MESGMHELLDVPTASEFLDKELDEQRALYRALTRSMGDMAHRGEQPPEHWQSLHSALSDHFVALSQGR